MPNTLAPRLLRARALMNMGERQRARQELTALAQAAPRSNDVRYQLALLDLIEGKYKDAEAGFDALMKAHDARGLNGMIETKAREGDFNGAIELVRSRIQQSPNDMDLHRLMADLDVRAKRPNDAVAEYRIVAQSQPTAENFTRLGDYQQIAGQTDAALQSYTKATTLKSNDAMPLVRMAILYENSGRTEDARKTYDQVLKLQPDNPYALNNIAYVKAEQGVDLDQALTYAERAQQKLPNDPNVSDTVGLIYLRKNMVEDSVRVLGDLVKRAPERSAYHLHYAAALVQKGDKAAARRELDAASRTGPTEQEKVRIEELRRKLSS
jgi:Flp pilus assembly protein TadD